MQDAVDESRSHDFISKDLAPSYYVECLLWNVPNSIFSGSYGQATVGLLSHLLTDLRDKIQGGKERDYMQANQVYVLFHPEFWRAESAVRFVSAVINHLVS